LRVDAHDDIGGVFGERLHLATHSLLLFSSFSLGNIPGVDDDATNSWIVEQVAPGNLQKNFLPILFHKGVLDGDGDVGIFDKLLKHFVEIAFPLTG